MDGCDSLLGLECEFFTGFEIEFSGGENRDLIHGDKGFGTPEAWNPLIHELITQGDALLVACITTDGG